MRVFVFGYGSLGAVNAWVPARLHGYRRAWNVAMDNREAIPGYKVYVDGAGERPDVRVTFLNLVPGDGVDGFALPATDSTLAALDVRERNYARVDVTALVEADVHGPVFTYLGLDDAVARFEAGHASGRAVVARGYLDEVRAAFPDVADPPLPVVDLTRVDLP